MRLSSVRLMTEANTNLAPFFVQIKKAGAKFAAYHAPPNRQPMRMTAFNSLSATVKQVYEDYKLKKEDQMRVQIAVIEAQGVTEIFVYAAHLSERKVVESIANGFECLSECFPKTLSELNKCAAGFTVTLSTEEVLTQ